MESTHVKVLQLFDMPAVQYTSLAPIQERGEDNSSVNYQLRRDANVMVIVHLCAPAPRTLALGLLCWSWMWLPSFEMMLPRYLTLSTFASGVSLVLMFGPTGGVWSRLVQYLGLAEADSQPEGLRRLLDLLICSLLSLFARRAQSSANRASWISWCQHFVFAFRCWRSKREKSRRYLISSMSCTACASMHLEKRLTGLGLQSDLLPLFLWKETMIPSRKSSSMTSSLLYFAEQSL